MYWLIGIVGGAFVYVFPQSGLLGIRLLGVIITTSTIILAYNLLKKHISIFHLRLALLLIIILISNDPKELNYDNLSMLLFVASVVLLFGGLQENKLSKILFGGALVGLNCFTRVTNILGLSLALGIMYYGYMNRSTSKYVIKQIVIFLGGFLFTVFAILLIMKLINHLKPFIDSVGIVFHMGMDKDSDHNFKYLLFNFFKKYFLSACYFAVIFVFGVAATLANNFLRSKKKFNIKNLYTILLFCFFVVVCYLTVIGRIKWVMLLFFMMGFTVTATLLIIANHQNKNIKLLTFFGILILFFYPAGSDEFVEMFSLWIAFPIALDYFFSVKKIDNILSVTRMGQQQSIALFIDEVQINQLKKIFIYTSIFIGLYYTYYYPYFNINNRITMQFTVENKYLKAIYTNKERADVVNELLKESAKYVKKNDYVLAYDCIPMFHYLTETRPFMYNPWPGAYLPDAFQNKLQESLLEKNKLPVVIIQKLNMLNSNWPENTKEIDSGNTETQRRNTCMINFLKTHHYRKVWENVAFEILLPDVSNIGY